MTDDVPLPEDFNAGEWLQARGADADIAVCTRVRFARNVKQFRFTTAMPAAEARELNDYLRGQLTRSDFVEGLEFLDVAALDDLRRQLLLERHLISREFATTQRPRSVAVNEAESVSVMVNEEDHIRAQVFQAGNSIDEAYRRAERLDEALMERVPIAFSEEFGFLTACPTNTGTGLRVSVMLHLPGLVWAEEIEKATAAAQKTNMAVRGLYGEGSRATGDFYQVSNQITLGRSEHQIAADVDAAVHALVAWERKVREALLKGEPRDRTIDRIYRALGTLERAHLLTTEDALQCLSAVRFGIQQGLIDHLPLERISAAVLMAQPGHLQQIQGRALGPDERARSRAALLRKIVGSS